MFVRDMFLDECSGLEELPAFLATIFALVLLLDMRLDGFAQGSIQREIDWLDPDLGGKSECDTYSS